MFTRTRHWALPVAFDWITINQIHYTSLITLQNGKLYGNAVSFLEILPMYVHVGFKVHGDNHSDTESLILTSVFTWHTDVGYYVGLSDLQTFIINIYVFFATMTPKLVTRPGRNRCQLSIVWKRQLALHRRLLQLLCKPVAFYDVQRGGNH